MHPAKALCAKSSTPRAGASRIVPDTKLLLAELKSGEWSLVIANVAMTGLE